MAPLGTPQNPLRLAIVGSGPAGFYTAEHLLKRDDLAIEVDMFDRLPTPFGLVRAGVAPDHPKIKSVIRVYEKTAAREGFQFFGNVEIGVDVTVAELEQRYNAVISAYGTAADRRLGIPGEDLPGSHAATEFVAWYNAHPDFADHDFDLSCERAVVIGNGNVAADVARMLALPRAELHETDTADHAIEQLTESRIAEIVVVGRRGPAQAAFTNPEVRELGELTDADIVIDPAEVELDPASRAYVESEGCDPTHRRNVELFTEFSKRPSEGKPKRVVMRFGWSPIELRGDTRVRSIVLGRNELYADESGAIRARDTGERVELECGLVLRSIGYRGMGVEGIPFDTESGLIPNDSGRVLDPQTGEPVRGHYVVGWIKRGPSGVIGTNKKDALDTVRTLLADLEAGELPEPRGSGGRGEAEDVAGVAGDATTRTPGGEAEDVAGVAGDATTRTPGGEAEDVAGVAGDATTRTPGGEAEDVAGVAGDATTRTPGGEAEDVAGVVPIAQLLDSRGGDHVTYMGWRAIDSAEVAAGEPHGRPRVKFCRVHEMVEAARSAAPS